MNTPPSAEWDLLITLTAAPFASEATTTVLRLLDAGLRQGPRIQVWACGYATALTQSSLGASKPADVLARDRRYPSTATLIGGLLRAYPDSFAWHVCRFCAEDRGALAHIDRVALRSFSRFSGCVQASAKTVYIGGA